MLNKELSDKIIETQGDLLFTTLSEECCELAQACSKISRCKFYKKDYLNVLDNFFEELCDLEINLELIKKQVIKDTKMTEKEYNTYINTWKDIKQQKLKKIFNVSNLDEYVNNLITAKYLTQNGEPIKCLHCGSQDLTDCNHYVEEMYVVEYDMKCKHCGEILGHWAYGNWEIF